ncbi:MAG: Crp/Fnr family transcriptional regulator [Bacteroidetes bacterium]|nr:Crp/Fnr family transcriptional regulator [Bacteroidota bacterium]
MNDELRKAITANVALSNDELEFVLSFFKLIRLNKEQKFLQQGKICDEVAFVQSGILRIFYFNEKGEETTCYFALENEFITSLKSFSSKCNSVENIQAIVATELLVIKKKDLEHLYNVLPKTQEFAMKAMEKVAIKMEERLALFLNQAAEARYSYLMANSPKLLKMVPLQYLASYIGVSPQHLSRLRKNVGKIIS